MAIIVDDMADTCGTLIAGVNILKREKGAKEHFACTHGLLSGPAIERDL